MICRIEHIDDNYDHIGVGFYDGDNYATNFCFINKKLFPFEIRENQLIHIEIKEYIETEKDKERENKLREKIKHNYFEEDEF